MLYLCPNCMDKDRITSGLQNNGIEIVDLPDESSLTLMDELYSYLDDGGALVSCDCPRDTQSNLRRVITNLSSEAAETRRWNVFIISRVDQDTDKLINRNNVIEVIYYCSTDEVIQKIRSRIGDGHRPSITEAVVNIEILQHVKDINIGVHNIIDQSAQRHEEVKQDLEQLKEGQHVISKFIVLKNNIRHSLYSLTVEETISK